MEPISPVVLLEYLNKDLIKTNPFVTSDMSCREAAAMSLRNSLVKKFLPQSQQCADDAAIDRFIADNRKCADWREPDGTLYIDDIMDTMKILVHDDFADERMQDLRLDWNVAANLGLHGPGASNGVFGQSFYEKHFIEPLTTTNPVLHKVLLSNVNASWLRAERHKCSAYGANSLPFSVVSGSKVFTVRKYESISRTCCKEPSLNMYFQQGYKTLLERRLKRRHNIDIRTQARTNQMLAREGSATGEYATIDLESASNLISTRFVQWLLPRGAFCALDIVRSKFTEVRGEQLELNMFSSMGNAFTFPLQTYIFATLIEACYIHLGVKPIKGGLSRNYGVFGDDMICKRETFAIICQVLTRCGFVVNDDKSFNTGHFRESCGGDFYRGYNIRGCYIKELSNETHVYSCFNRLVRWSATNGISVSNLLRFVKGLVAISPVPLDESDVSGHKLPLSSVTSRKSDRNGALWYRARRVIRVGERQKTISASNPEGAFLCALGGFAANGDLELKPHKGYREIVTIVRQVTPSWDFLSNVGFNIRDVESVMTYIDL